MAVNFYIDPGFRALGLVVYDTWSETFLVKACYLQDAAVYKHWKDVRGATVADAFVVEKITAFLEKYRRKHHTEHVHMELPHGGQSYNAVRALSIVTGAIIGWAISNNIELHYYTPATNKRACTGNSRAGKLQMEMAARQAWPGQGWGDLEDKEREHICDAACLIITADNS